MDSRILRSIVLATAVLSTTAVALAPAYAQEGSSEEKPEQQEKPAGGGDGG
jgi:hypothetical protein